MVKIPGLEDLKKMGADLIDSAKSVNISETVDKLRSTVEAFSGKKEAAELPKGDPVQAALTDLSISLNELIAMEILHTNTIKKIQGQLTNLTRMIEINYKPVTLAVEIEPKQEDIKK